NRHVQFTVHHKHERPLFFYFSQIIPKCVLCLQMLANETLKPAKLKRHLQTRHPEYKNKTKDFFLRKSEEYTRQKTTMVNISTISNNAQKISYLLSQQIAKAKKPHTIGEDLIIPSAEIICENMFGKEFGNKVKAVPLSNDTVKRRVEDLSDDIQSQLLDRLRPCPQFSIQLDEATDIACAAELIVLVRYPWERKILEDFLFCKEVLGRTTGEEIFGILDAFMTEAGLSWEKCVAVCTDGAAAMTGRNKGVIARIKAVNPKVIATHCMLHRQALASKDMEPDLHSVLNTVVTAVNFVKSRALQTRLFAKLCKEMGADHDTLLFHSEVRWLSRGKVLQRVCELRNEMSEFMREHKPDIAEFFSNPECVAKLAYLADVFNLLNDLNLSIQGGYASILEVSDKILAFMKKTQLWSRRIQDGITDIKVVTSHLTALSEHFSSYFTDVNTAAWDWVDLTGKAEEELLELSCDGTLKVRFRQLAHEDFWASLSHEYPELTTEAMRILLPFPTTYLCQSSFSTMTAIKTKYRARLHVENDLRVCLSSISPRLDKLCNEKQAHPSH
uniref:DUF4371 domain-containing protein n=1 Tax=Myripristis murdjan TaxID=586833 RepID=A0A667WR08_9TELE